MGKKRSLILALLLLFLPVLVWAKAAPAKDSWTIYLYLCGSNLESKDGSATRDLNEVVAAELPENVKVLVQTGGSKLWQNSTIKSNVIQRYVHTGPVDSFQLVDERPDANMSDPQTLTEFLQYGKDNYPAQHNAFIFWDHGGGSVAGAISDERYPGTRLSLNAMKQAFSAVYPNPKKQKPFEMIGFDACLMATIDTANNFAPYANYFTASEEEVPGNGWYYTPWLSALAQNPKMKGDQLGQLICDSFLEGCTMVGTEKAVTLSVTDLNKLPALVAAYNNMGQEALKAAAADPNKFVPQYGRGAMASENYGGNTDKTGYSNMVDLGDLARNTVAILPATAETLQRELGNCVLYKVNGPYRSKSTGLSGYYLYGFSEENLQDYFKVESASEPFKMLYSYIAAGPGKENTIKRYLDATGGKSMGKLNTLKTNPLENAPVKILEDGTAELNLGAKQADMLKSVRFILTDVSRKDDLLFVLGTDNDLIADWDKGIFKDNFHGTWPALNKHYVFLDVIDDNADYTLYAIPIKLNGERSTLIVAYDNQKEKYDILGARKGIDNYGTSAKDMRKLEPKDKITTIHYGAKLSQPQNVVEAEVDTFTVGKNPIFADELIDSKKENFAFMFEMTDMQNNTATSEVVFFQMDNGKIYLSKQLEQ